MLIERIAPQDGTVPRQDVHGVFDVNVRQNQMRGIGNDAIDRSDQPLAEIDDMLEGVLNRPTPRFPIDVVRFAIRRSLGREMLASRRDHLQGPTEPA